MSALHDSPADEEEDLSHIRHEEMHMAKPFLAPGPVVHSVAPSAVVDHAAFGPVVQHTVRGAACVKAGGP
jgi:hypothetical protein